MKFVDVDGNPVEHIESFGNLSVQGTVTLNHDNRDLNIAHTIMSTSLSAEEWCDNSLFELDVSEHGFCYKKLILDNNLFLNSDSRLSK